MFHFFVNDDHVLLVVENGGRYTDNRDAKEKEQKLVILEEALNFLADKKEARYMDIWTTLGEEYLKLGETERAITALRTTIEINPNMRKVLAGSFPEETPKEIIEQIMKN